MMSPLVLEQGDGSVVALGSGGSERIRSALALVVLRLVDGAMSLADAVAAPRIHPHDGVVEVEPGLPRAVVRALSDRWQVREWSAPDLYFGGVQAAMQLPDGRVTAVADHRRGGATRVLPI